MTQATELNELYQKHDIHLSDNNAMNKALAHVAETFRTERKEKNAIMLNGYRVKHLVQSGRYSFKEAASKLKLVPGSVAEAFRWLEADNRRLNRMFDCDLHEMTVEDWFMLGYINSEEAEDETVVKLEDYRR